MAIPFYHADVIAAFDASGIRGVKAVLDDATTIVALSGEAATYADATTNFGVSTGKRMASAAIDAADVTLVGTGLGLKVRFAGKAGGVAAVDGNPTVVAYLDGTRILAQIAENTATVFDLATSAGAAFSAHDIIGPATIVPPT